MFEVDLRLHNEATETHLPLYVSMKVVAYGCLLWGMGGLTAHAQEKPSPPIPHTQPALPGTHVPPQPLIQKSEIVLHIDGPTTVNQKMCMRHTFDLTYSVINHSTAPANGTIRAAFNGSWLTPVGSGKLTSLPPGKVVSGAFTACCPAIGIFAARMEYRDDPSTAQNKTAGHLRLASDTVNISCR
jgi:hypothetical protein